MRGYRVKRTRGRFKVQVRFLLFWRTLAVYPYVRTRCGSTEDKAEREAYAIALELIRRTTK